MSPLSSPELDNKKNPKLQGRRSVSALTSAQLESKRAKDRENQRATRAMRKAHIRSLEQQLEKQNRAVKELIGRNTALEIELRCLKETFGILITLPSHTALEDDGDMSAINRVEIPSSTTAGARTDYSPLSNYYQQCDLLPMIQEKNALSFPTSTIPHSMASPFLSVDAAGYCTGVPLLRTSTPVSVLFRDAGGSYMRQQPVPDALGSSPCEVSPTPDGRRIVAKENGRCDWGHVSLMRPLLDNDGSSTDIDEYHYQSLQMITE